MLSTSTLCCLVSLLSFTSGAITLGAFKRDGGTSHDLKSDPIEILDTKTIRIPSLRYDGKGPDAFFMTGYGSPPPNRPSDTPGHKIPNENGSCNKLEKYQGETIELILPENFTVNNIDWLAMYCIQYKHTFGWVDFKTPRGGPSFTEVPEAKSNVVPPQACGQTRTTSAASLVFPGVTALLFRWTYGYI